jgi:aspartyl-tRNA(Asn)/glutamyl-tRNA(Gln) amidotransferase subunit A
MVDLEGFFIFKAERGREEMQANQIGRTDAVTLARMIRRKQVSAKEVTEAVLARMEKLEPHIHAFCTPTPDLARKAAQKIDRRLTKGEEVGPLAGVPIGIKDLVCT